MLFRSRRRNSRLRQASESQLQSRRISPRKMSFRQPTKLFTARKLRDATGSKRPPPPDAESAEKRPASPELPAGAQVILHYLVFLGACPERSRRVPWVKGFDLRPASQIEERAARIATSRREDDARARTFSQVPQAVRSARGRGGHRIFPSAAGTGWTLQADKCHAPGLAFDLHGLGNVSGTAAAQAAVRIHPPPQLLGVFHQFGFALTQT